MCHICAHRLWNIAKKRILFCKNAAKSFHVCKPMCCTLATTSFANLQNKSWRVFRTKHAHSQTKRTRVRSEASICKPRICKPCKTIRRRAHQVCCCNMALNLQVYKKRHCANSLCCKISAKVMQRLYIHDASLMRTIWKTRCASSLNKFCNVAR